MRHARLIALGALLCGLATLQPEAWAYPIWTAVGGLRLLTRFYVPLTANGIAEADPTSVWPTITGGPAAPSVAWWGGDATGYGTATYGTWTLGGSTESINTPFCRDGGWNDITGGCMTAQRFDGTNDYYDADSEFSDPLTNDFTVCALYRTKADSYSAGILVSKRNAGNTNGWALWAHNSGATCQISFESAAPQTESAGAAVALGQWQLCCGVRDYDGNIYASANGTTGAGNANTTASIDVAEVVSVGSEYATHAAKFAGDIAAVFIWPTTALSAAQLSALYTYILGVRDTEGAAQTITNTGPICATVDGQLECFADDMPAIGSEISPGLSGAGSPASGLLISPQYTNGAVRSRALNSTWYANNKAGSAAVVATGNTSTPFRDGRATCRITDDSDVSEWISQGVDITALNVGDKFQVCVWARDAAGTVLDLRLIEDIGAGCSTTTTDYPAATIDATWKQYQWTHTILDGDCTVIATRFCPADCAVDAATGTAQLIVQAFAGLDYCPQIYIETGAAAVSAGADLLGYTISSSSIMDGAGAAVGAIAMLVDVAPTVANIAAAGYPLAISDGTATNYVGLAWSTAEKLVLESSAATHVTSTNTCATPGTWCPVIGNYNFDADSYSVVLGGTTDTDATARVSPTGMTTLYLGARTSAATAVTGGFWIRNIRIRR